MIWYLADWLGLTVAIAAGVKLRRLSPFVAAVLIAELAAGGTGLRENVISMSLVDLVASGLVAAAARDGRDIAASALLLLMVFAYQMGWWFGLPDSTTAAIVDGIAWVMMGVVGGLDRLVFRALRAAHDRILDLGRGHRMGLRSVAIRRDQQGDEEAAPQVAGRRWS